MNQFTLKRTDCNDPDFRKLIHLLDNDLRSSNGEETQLFFDQYNIIVDVDTVVLAYVDGVAAGCGCFKQFDDHSVEAKRMFVVPDNRGVGIAAAILNELQLWAKELNNSRMVLETGARLKPAVSLYKKHGFAVIENWGQYIGVPDSICMSREL